MPAPHHPLARRAAALVAALALAAGLAACGASGGDDAASTKSTGDDVASSTTRAKAADDEGGSEDGSEGADEGGSDEGDGASVACSDWKVSKDTSKAPVIAAKATANVPTSLVQRDVTVGSGPAATADDELTVQYSGISCSNAEPFDASWNRGEPFTFRPSDNNVIQGWIEGVIGMKVGGRRVLVIPPDQGYGPSGSGPIGPNETLFFVVDLVSIG